MRRVSYQAKWRTLEEAHIHTVVDVKRLLKLNSKLIKSW